MSDKKNKKQPEDRSDWATGGGFMLGLGVGFFLLPNALAFIGSIMAGIGLGLILTSILDKQNNKHK